MPPIFRFYPEQNTNVRPIGYSLVELVQYINTTDNYTDPCTREPYSERDLWRMHALMTTYKLNETMTSPWFKRQRNIVEAEHNVRVQFRALMHPAEGPLFSMLRAWTFPYILGFTQYVHALEELSPTRARAVCMEALAEATGRVDPWERHKELMEVFMCQGVVMFIDDLLGTIDDNGHRD